MKIATDSIVTIYGDILAFLILLGLLFIAADLRHNKDEHSNRLFTILCFVTMGNALSNAISYMLHHQNLGWPRILRMIMPGIAEYTSLAVLFVWFIYIEYKLYDSWERAQYIEKMFRIPMIITLILFILNLPFGFVYEVGEDFTFVAKPLFNVFTVLSYVVGILPVASYIRYVINHGFKHFFHLSPVVLPTLVASLFTLLTSYSARAFGYAIAIVFLYCSYINKWRFDDDETGFYNRNYINHLKALARDGKADYRGALFLVTSSMPKDFCEMVKTEVPKGGEIIRIERDQLLLLSESGNSSMLEVVSDMIAEDAEAYDREHPDSPIDLSSLCVLRKKNESAEEFLRRLKGEIA